LTKRPVFFCKKCFFEEKLQKRGLAMNFVVFAKFVAYPRFCPRRSASALLLGLSRLG
jgi:hypothetical protein